MAKTRFVQTSFTSGVLSPLINGRIDINQFYNGLQEGENVVLIPQGGIKRRPGTQYIDKLLPVLDRNTTVPTAPNGGTAANVNDSNESTVSVTTANISTTNPYVVVQFDLTNSTYIELFDLQGIFLTVSGTSSEFVIQSSANATDWTTRATVPLIGTNAQDLRVKVAASDRYWRLARVGTDDLGTNKVQVSEINLWELTSTLSEVKLKDFSISSEEHYLLAFTDGNCRIYTNGTYQADIKTSFLSSEVKAIRDVQS